MQLNTTIQLFAKELNRKLNFAVWLKPTVMGMERFNFPNSMNSLAQIILQFQILKKRFNSEMQKYPFRFSSLVIRIRDVLQNLQIIISHSAYSHMSMERLFLKMRLNKVPRLQYTLRLILAWDVLASSVWKAN